MNETATRSPGVGNDAGGLTRDRLLVITLLIVTGIAIGACIVVVAPFLPALTWALALAVVAQPIVRWIGRRVHRRELAAGLAVVIVALVIVVPLVLLIIEIGHEVVNGLQQVQAQISSGFFQSTLEAHPKIARAFDWLQDRVNLGQATAGMLDTIRSHVVQLLGTTVWSFIQLGVALYALFFFFRDRAHLLGVIRCLVPLSEREIDEVFDDVRAMVHATIYGNVATSLIQGALGGLMFWILGIPGALLWGVAMFFVTLVPTLGSFLVWGPAVIILALSGHWVKAIVLLAWGVIVVGSIDNILYPLLVGRDIRIHTLAVFLALLGGMFVFGAAGLVLGPVLLAITLALIDILRRRTQDGRPAEEPT